MTIEQPELNPAGGGGVERSVDGSPTVSPKPFQL